MTADPQLAHEIAGTGDLPPLVWSHGLLGSRRIDDVLGVIDHERLARERVVLRYDNVGHGSSPTPSDPARYSWAALARDQLALADSVGIDRYVAGGDSMGAAIAIHAGLAAPERVRGLILVIPPCAWSSRAAASASYLLGADLLEGGHADLVAAEVAAGPPPDPVAGDERWTHYTAAVADELRRRGPLLSPVLRGAARCDLPSPDRISSFASPALVLAWSGDAGHPVEVAEALAASLPVGELAVARTADDLRRWPALIESFLGDVVA
jgi:pimeloyl-ACP methyl ester carboxylesterase